MNNSKFKKGLTGSQKALKGFQKQMKAIGGMIAGAFAVTAIVNFSREAVQLAAKMQGIEAAFKRLDSPSLLNNLREATRGTVSDLELMQQAVRAENFQIPLENLATYFEFATKRSIQTGESVDYLVDSIINGIGRKSTLVMDNLGISAAALQDEIKKTGDFAVAAGNLIKQGIQDMGDVADTAAIKIQEARVIWENFKADAGGVILQSAAKNIKDFQARLYLLRDDGVPILDKLWAATSGEMTAVIALADEWREYNKSLETTKTVVKDIVWQYRDGITSGIDWAKVNKDIFDNWVKVNDALREQISLKQKSLDLDIDMRNETIKTLKTLGGTYDPSVISNPQYKPTFDFNNDEEWGGGSEAWEMFGDGLSGVTNQAKELGDQVGMMLVNQFDALGVAIGQFAAGAEDSFRSLGDAIMQNIGNILIMLGSQTGNIPMMVAGAGIQLGGGILRGLGNQSTRGASTSGNAGGTVNFRIQGKDLVGSLKRYNDYNFMST